MAAHDMHWEHHVNTFLLSKNVYRNNAFVLHFLWLLVCFAVSHGHSPAQPGRQSQKQTAIGGAMQCKSRAPSKKFNRKRKKNPPCLQKGGKIVKQRGNGNWEKRVFLFFLTPLSSCWALRLEGRRTGGVFATCGFQGKRGNNKAPHAGFQLPEESASLAPPLISHVPAGQRERKKKKNANHELYTSFLCWQI